MGIIKKFFGWVLVLAGLCIIGYALFSSYNIFTGKELPPEVFSMGERARVEVQDKGLSKIVSQQLKEVIPYDSITKLFNLISWSILAGILIFGGAQIASLGIKLLK